MRLLKQFAIVGVTYLAISGPIWGQDVSKDSAPDVAKPAEDKAKAEKPPFTAVLLLIKADWSKSPAAKEIETDLRAALKDASIPLELLDKLPASGPQILFAPEMAGLYHGEELAQLLSWLKAKELIEKIEPLDAPQRGPDRNAAGDAHMPNFITVLKKPLDFIDLPSPSGFGVQPFVARNWGLWWNLSTPEVGTNFNVKQEIVVVTKRHGEKEDAKESADSTYFGFDLPLDQAALVNAFPAKDEQMYRDAARRKGFEVVLLIARSEAHARLYAAEPRFHLPERVLVLNAQRRKVLAWPSIGGRRGGGSGFGGGGAIGGRGGASPVKPDSTAGATAGNISDAPSQDNVEELKMFRLKYAKATALAGILKQLFPAVKLNVAAEERTNSIIAQGSNEMLLRVEAILRNLDEGSDNDPAPAGNSRPGAVRTGLAPAAGESSAAKYKQAEQAAGAAAQELRALDPTSGKNEAQLKELRTTLRGKVAAAFEARQKMLQAELAEIEARLREVKETIELRNRISDQIIERRVDDLLDPDRQSQVPRGADGLQRSAANPAGSPDAASSSPAKRSDLVASSSDAAKGDSLDDAATNKVFGSPEALRRLVDEAEQSLKTARGEAAVSLEQLQKALPDAEFPDLEKHRPEAYSEFVRRWRQLQLARDQLTAQIHLLRLERDDAQAAHVTAADELSVAEKLVNTGAMPASALPAKRRELQQIELRIQRAQILLELYQKIDSPALSAPSSPAKDSSGTIDAGKILADELGIHVDQANEQAVAGTRFRGGLRITKIRPDSPAARENIKVGDILVGLHLWETITPENAVFAVQNAPEVDSSRVRGPRRLKFFVLRNGETLSGHLTLPGAS